MKVALRSLLMCALLLVAGSGAQAQGDEVLERYGLALANLSESMSALSSDITASRDELDRAAGALRFLAARANSPRLIGAMEQVFERARVAIQNRSPTDLGVQTSLLRGGFQRAIYDSAISVAEADRDTAMARLERLASDLDFSEESRAALARASGVDGLRRAFDAGVAESIRKRLQLAEERYADSRDDAYRALADAYADFLLIQDSPRADSALNSMFAEAVEGLVGNRGEEMVAGLQSLGQSFEQLTVAARSPSTENSGQQAGAEGDQGAVEGEAEGAVEGQVEGQSQIPLPLEAVAAQETAPEGSQPAESGPAESGSAGSQPGASPSGQADPFEGIGPEQAGDGQANAAPAAPAGENSDAGSADAASARSAAPDASAATAGDEQLRSLQRELVLAGVPVTRATVLASDLQDRGVPSLQAAMDDLYAGEARLLAALQVGDEAEAQRRLEALKESYGQVLKPVLALVSPAVESRTSRLFEKLSDAPLLRTQDGLALLGQFSAVASLLIGEGAAPVRAAITETGATWSGWLRLAVLIFLALLAAVPLYLLNLAFGGGNRNWQLIGVALFLLLLPLIYEGLASLAGVIGYLVGVPALSSGMTFSMFQNPIGQLAWVAVTAAGILFATAGLYGICVQFGLLGKRRASPGDSQTMISTSVIGDSDTTVDWDEEF